MKQQSGFVRSDAVDRVYNRIRSIRQDMQVSELEFLMAIERIKGDLSAARSGGITGWGGKCD